MRRPPVALKRTGRATAVISSSIGFMNPWAIALLDAPPCRSTAKSRHGYSPKVKSPHREPPLRHRPAGDAAKYDRLLALARQPHVDAVINGGDMLPLFPEPGVPASAKRPPSNPARAGILGTSPSIWNPCAPSTARWPSEIRIVPRRQKGISRCADVGPSIRRRNRVMIFGIYHTIFHDTLLP